MSDVTNSSTNSSAAGDESATRSSLLAGAWANDPESWCRLTALYAPLVLWWCRRQGLPEHAAQDVVQEVFIALFKGGQDFAKDGRPGSFRRWLRSITWNKGVDWVRRNPSHPPLPDKGVQEADGVETASERCLVLRAALQQVRGEFETRTWAAMWKVVVDGRRTKDVAAELGMTVGAVHTAKSRVLSRLRRDVRLAPWRG